MLPTKDGQIELNIFGRLRSAPNKKSLPHYLSQGSLKVFLCNWKTPWDSVASSISVLGLMPLLSKGLNYVSKITLFLVVDIF